MSILISILILTGLGIIFGIGLAIAAKRFCVNSDPRIDEIYAKLPGANCGACGKAGCIGFAQALIQGDCTPESCTVSKESARSEISKILGVETKTNGKEKTAAVVCCHGGSKRVKDKFVYSGIKDCLAANQLSGGQKACIYGCIGFGSCVMACPFGAISMNEESLPVVNEKKCTACGQCVAICPKKLFMLIPVTKEYLIRCKSRDTGKKVMDVCSAGCIACRKCEKACPAKCIKITDNLAEIDYGQCKNIGECFKVCPTKAIGKRGQK